MAHCSRKVVSTIVGEIYEAAYEPSAWPGVVDALMALFHGSKACLVRVAPDMRPDDAIAANTDPTFMARFQEEFGDEPNLLLEAATAAPVGLVYRDHELVGPERLRSSRFWNEWMAPQDMYGGLACKLLASGASSWMFDVQRGRKQAAFDAADAELFELIVPHIRRAVEIGRRLQISNATAAAFTHPPVGIVLVDEVGRILICNEAADAILARPGSPLRRTSGHLVVAEASRRATLAQFVFDACSTPDGITRGRGGDFLATSVGYSDDSPALSVSVGPFVRARFEDLFFANCAMVTMRELTLAVPVGFEDHIRDVFELTRKEAEIAAMLACGQTLKAAARRANIQFSTARTHLTKIFQKTGTRQQSQLVALLKSA